MTLPVPTHRMLHSPIRQLLGLVPVFSFPCPKTRGCCLGALALVWRHSAAWGGQIVLNWNFVVLRCFLVLAKCVKTVLAPFSVLERGRCLKVIALVVTHLETWSVHLLILERGRCLDLTALVLIHLKTWSGRHPILETERCLTASALVLTHSEIWSVRRPSFERERSLTASALVLKHAGMTWNDDVGSARFLGMAENCLVGSNSS